MRRRRPKPQTQAEFDERYRPREQDYIYVCAECGEKFTHYWRGVNRAEYVHFPSSLLRHREETGHDIYPEEMKRERERRQNEYYHEDYDDCTPSFEGGFWTDPNDPTA